MQEVLSQSSFLSNSDSRLHFGLGVATQADINVRWISGKSDVFINLPADQIAFIDDEGWPEAEDP